MTPLRNHNQPHVVRARNQTRPNPQPGFSTPDQHTPADAFAAGFDNEKILLTVDETMRLLRVGRTKFYELLDAQAFDTIKLGGSRRIVATSLHNYLTSLLPKT